MSDNPGVEPDEQRKELIAKLGLEMSDDDLEEEELGEEELVKDSEKEEESDFEISDAESVVEFSTEVEPSTEEEVSSDEESDKKVKTDKEEGELSDDEPEEPTKPEVRTYAPKLPNSAEFDKKLVKVNKERSAERREDSAHRAVEERDSSNSRSRSRSRERPRDEHQNGNGGRREGRMEQERRREARQRRDRRNSREGRRLNGARAYNHHRDNRGYSPQRYRNNYYNDHRNAHGYYRDRGHGYGNRDNYGRARELEARDRGNGRLGNYEHRRDNVANYFDKKMDDPANGVCDLAPETHANLSQGASQLWESSTHPSQEFSLKPPSLSSFSALQPMGMEATDLAAQKKNTNNISQSHLVTSDPASPADLPELNVAHTLLTPTKVSSGFTLLTPPTPSPAHSNPQFTEITPKEGNVPCNKEGEIKPDSTEPSELGTDTAANTTMQTGGKSFADMMNGAGETVERMNEKMKAQAVQQKVRMATAHRQSHPAASPILLSPPMTPITSPHAPSTPNPENRNVAPTSVPGVTPLATSFKIPKKARDEQVGAPRAPVRPDHGLMRNHRTSGGQRRNETRTSHSSNSNQHRRRHGDSTQSSSNSRSKNEKKCRHEKRTAESVLDPVSDKALANSRKVKEDTEKWKLELAGKSQNTCESREVQKPDSARVANGPDKASDRQAKKIPPPKEPEHGEPEPRKAHTSNESQSDRARNELNARAATIAANIEKTSRKRSSKKMTANNDAGDGNQRGFMKASDSDVSQPKKTPSGAAAKKIRVAPATAEGISPILSAILDDACEAVCKTETKESPVMVAERKFEETLHKHGLKVGTPVENRDNPAKFMKLIRSDDFKKIFIIFDSCFYTLQDKIDCKEFESVASFCKAFNKIIKMFDVNNKEDEEIQQKCNFLRVLYKIHFSQDN